MGYVGDILNELAAVRVHLSLLEAAALPLLCAVAAPGRRAIIIYRVPDPAELDSGMERPVPADATEQGVVAALRFNVETQQRPPGTG